MKLFTALLLGIAVVFCVSIGQPAFAFPTVEYVGTYYIWNTRGTADITDDIQAVKIEEDVYRFPTQEITGNILSEWYYGYTVTNLSAPNIYSLHLQDAHPVVGVTSPAAWSYDGSLEGYHVWSTATAPITTRFGGGNYIIGDFGLWINDLIPVDPTDGDHGYVSWNVDLGGQGMLAGNYRIDKVSAPVLPEPASMLLLGMGILGLVTLRRKT